MNFKRVIIHFFSGTGNSFRVAKWFHDAAQQKGADASLFSLTRGRRGEEAAGGADQLTVVVTPTHGFTAPWAVIRACLLMPRGHGDCAVVVVTRAGSKVGSVFLPGVDGTAAYLLALILFLKGYCVRGAIGLDMPSNWMAVHPGFRKETAEAIIANTRPRAERFFGRILDGRRFFGSWIAFPLGLLLIPVSFGYLLFGRIMLAKLMFASTACNGCGVCAANCPEGAILMCGKDQRWPYWTFRCESCLRCMAFCPQKAVEVSHGLAAMMIALLSSFPPAALVAWGLSRGFLPFRTGGIVEWLLTWMLTVAACCLLYAVFTLLTRVPLILSFFSFATFTRYFRRYVEPETSLSDLS